MKRFDQQGILERLRARMRVNSNWATYLENGVVDNLLSVYAEGLAELARYLEYLALEKKWLTAQNMSSLVSMSKLISRKPRRPMSASGFIVVSHSDITGVKRLDRLGRSFFNIDDISDYDDSVDANINATPLMKSALVPWRYKDSYRVPEGTVFTSAGGIKFISTEDMVIKSFNDNYSLLKSAGNETRYEQFIKEGGWDKIKYLKIPVVQGIPRATTLGLASGQRFESFTISNNNVEDASSRLTQKYFYVEVITSDTSSATTVSEKWQQISNIRLAGPYDKVFECITSDDLSQLTIKFGDGVSGHLLTANTKVVLHYLETAGAEGNVESKYQIVKMEFPYGQRMIDPRTNTISDFLSCTNIYPLSGGKAAEDYDDFKLNAPVSYLQYYATATVDEYQEKILRYSPISLLRCKVFSGNSFTLNNLDTSISDIYCEVATEYTTIQNNFYITALQSNGKVIENAETTFIEPLIKAFANKKSPNDSFTYIEPNLIPLSVSATISTSSLVYSDDMIYEIAKQDILRTYSIFNSGFKDNFYMSTIVSDIKLHDFSDTVSVFIEAIANIKYDEISTLRTSDDNEEMLVAIPFSFDSIFKQNKYLKGLKNYKTDSGYLVKALVSFKDKSKQSKNRMFLLFDGRASDEYDIESAKSKPINKDDLVPSVTSVLISDLDYTISFYDEKSNYFYNRQVRTAQYICNSDIITDTSGILSLKDFSQFPSEQRYYRVDSTGKTVLGTKAGLMQGETFEALSGTSTDDSIGYYKNNNYIDYVDILFTESYDDNSDSTGSGILILPLSYFGIKESDMAGGSTVSDLIQTFAEIKIMAQPQMSDFYPANWNDLVYVDNNSISIGVKHILNQR